MSINTDLLIQMAALAIKGQTVLVTGATGGIGSAIARLFLRAGCNVIVTGSNQAKLDRLAATLSEEQEAGGGRVFAFVCDLRDRAAVAALVQQTVDECPTVDVLINNAGYALDATAPFWEQDLANVDSVLGVDLSGLMHLTHGILARHMIPRLPLSRGTILNLSSVTGHQAPPKEGFEASYHTAKAAVEAFSNVLRHETVGTNVRVLVHRPGTAETEFHLRRTGYDAAQTAANFAGTCPLVAGDLAVGVLWQCLQPERVSVVLMETYATSQRSLYVMDRGYEGRNPGHREEAVAFRVSLEGGAGQQ